jgi:hypothetical protein
MVEEFLKLPEFYKEYFCNLLIIWQILRFISEHRCPLGCSWSVALIPFRSLKRIVGHSRVRFIKNG